MEKFEKRFPFYRMHITPFSDRIFSINKPRVSEDELQKKFRSEAWKGVYESGTELSNLLTCLPKCVGGSLDTVSVILLGILWCAGTIKEKAEVLIKLVLKPNQTDISPMDS